MRIAHLFCISISALSCASTSGQTYYIQPTDASVETDNGVNWTIDRDSLALSTARFFNGIERRGILEYPIEAIPENAVIRSAAIGIGISDFSYSGNSYPVIQFHGYAGDGILSTIDATRPFNLLGESPPITTLDDSLTIELDSAYIQSLLSKSTHLGLYTYQAVLGRQVGFW